MCVCVSARVFFFFFNPLIYCWNWSCFHIIIINNTSMNTRCMYLFKLVFSFSGAEFSFPGAELLDFMEVPFLIFETPSYCFPHWLYKYTFPPIVNLLLFFPHFHQYLLFWAFLMITLTGMRWVLNSLHFTDNCCEYFHVIS